MVNSVKGMLLFVFIVINTNCIGQTVAQTFEKELTQAEQFSTQAGTLIEKQFIKIGSVKGIEVSVIKFKDLNSGASKSALRFQYEYKSQYSSDSKLASLDIDEIEGLIKSMTNFQKSVFAETRSVYTEVTYRSRTGLEAGAFYDVEKKKWTAFLKLEKHDKNSLVFLATDDFHVIRSLVEQAQIIM